MKNSKVDAWLTGIFAAGIVCTAAGSWVAAIYDFPVRPLLSEEGIRWTLKSVLSNFAKASLSPLLMTTATIGLLVSSGLGTWIHSLWKSRHISLKQRSATGITLFTLSVYLILVLLGLFLPHSFLLGVTGRVSQSAFAEGWVGVCCVGLILTGIVYGTASGTFRSFLNVLDGLGAGLSFYAPCFTTLFFMAQWTACVAYMDADIQKESWWPMACQLLYLSSFVVKTFSLFFQSGGVSTSFGRRTKW